MWLDRTSGEGGGGRVERQKEEGGGMGKPGYSLSWGVPSQELWAMAPPSGPLRNHFCTELAGPGEFGWHLEAAHAQVWCGQVEWVGEG